MLDALFPLVLDAVQLDGFLLFRRLLWNVTMTTSYCFYNWDQLISISKAQIIPELQRQIPEELNKREGGSHLSSSLLVGYWDASNKLQSEAFSDLLQDWLLLKILSAHRITIQNDSLKLLWWYKFWQKIGINNFFYRTGIKTKDFLQLHKHKVPVAVLCLGFCLTSGFWAHNDSASVIWKNFLVLRRYTNADSGFCSRWTKKKSIHTSAM